MRRNSMKTHLLLLLLLLGLASCAHAATERVLFRVEFTNSVVADVVCTLAGKEPLPAPGFDLRTGEALPPEEATKVMTAAWATAVPLGMAKAGYLFNATVLLYAPAIGGFDPTTAEYVALITGGWLE